MQNDQISTSKIAWVTLESMNEDLINCEKCRRLKDFRDHVLIDKENKTGERYWRKPVPGFGDPNGRLMVLGLAPAATGANRTGRIFTGDKSSEFLVSCLYEAGFCNHPYSISREDGLKYYNCYINAAVRCVPPDNIPAKEEIANCLPYLKFELSMLKNLKAVLALGRIAFESVIMAMDAKSSPAKGKFSHGSSVMISGIRVFCSYHPSPRNVNTGRMTRDSFMKILFDIRKYIDQSTQ